MFLEELPAIVSKTSLKEQSDEIFESGEYQETLGSPARFINHNSLETKLIDTEETERKSDSRVIQY